MTPLIDLTHLPRRRMLKGLFVGPAEFIPFRPMLLNSEGWRMVLNFGSGSLVDWGSHLMDTAQLAVNAPETCPVEVEGTGEIPHDALTNVSVQFDLNFRYSTGVEVKVKSGGTGIRLGRKLRWDAKKEEFINDAEANALRSYSYRDWAKA